jgi:hypothetical protein
MSRYDEIRTMARGNHHHLACTSPSRLSHHKALCYGAEWADETMIEKACKWLSLLADGFEITDKVLGQKYEKEELIDDFKKSMKI